MFIRAELHHRTTTGFPTFGGLLAGLILLMGAPALAAPADAPRPWIVEAPEAVHVDETFLEFLRRSQAGTTPTAPLAATTITLPLDTTVGPQAAATSMPAVLTEPATGTVMGFPVPLALDNCVFLALEHNFGLMTSERNVEIARSVYTQERYEFIPFVDLFSGYTYTDSRTGLRDGSGLTRTHTYDFNVGVRASQRFPTGGDVSVTNQVDRSRTWERFRVETIDPETGRVSDVMHETAVDKGYENMIDVRVRQPLLRGGGLDVGLANLRQARLGQIQAELNDRIRRRDAVLLIIQSYFAVLLRQLNAKVSFDSLRERRRFLEDTKFLERAGDIARSEVRRAEVRQLQEEERLTQLERAYLDSIDGLKLRMGVPIETALRLREFPGRLTTLKALKLENTEGLVKEALANRPELILADLAIRNARISLEVAKNNVLPSLDLEASYGDTEAGRHLSDTRHLDDSRTWSLGALFDLPFPNKANREARRRAQLRLEQAEIDRESLERDITEEIRRLHRSLLSNYERIRILEETLKLAALTLTLENESLQLGERTPRDVREAQDDYFQASSDYNGALLGYQSDLAGLYRSLGRPLYAEGMFTQPPTPGGGE